MAAHRRRRRLYTTGDLLLVLTLLAVASGYGWAATTGWPGP